MNLCEDVTLSMRRAEALETKLPAELLALPGMSGRKYRIFINELVGRLFHPVYLEVGVLTGSTLCSAMYGNTHGRFTAVDDWSEFGGIHNKIDLLRNLVRFAPYSPKTLALFETDFRQIEWPDFGPKADIYLYDGSHQYQDQLDGISLVLPALADRFVLLVDDWNYPHVQDATREALRPLTILSSTEIRTTTDGTHPAIWGPDTDWHNGVFVAVVDKS